MKIVASLIFLGLCTAICNGDIVPTSQFDAMAAS